MRCSEIGNMNDLSKQLAELKKLELLATVSKICGTARLVISTARCSAELSFFAVSDRIGTAHSSPVDAIGVPSCA